MLFFSQIALLCATKYFLALHKNKKVLQRGNKHEICEYFHHILLRRNAASGKYGNYPTMV
jgi:hypothetical protein